MGKIKVTLTGKINYNHIISGFSAAKVIALIESQEPKPTTKSKGKE